MHAPKLVDKVPMDCCARMSVRFLQDVINILSIEFVPSLQNTTAVKTVYPTSPSTVFTILTSIHTICCLACWSLDGFLHYTILA